MVAPFPLTGPGPAVAACVAFATAFVLTPLLARRARARGRGDAARGAAATRKPQARAVPTVGGTAVLAGLAVGAIWSGEARLFDPLGLLGLAEGGGEARALLWGGLVAAFAVGALDDALADGLRPLAKLAGQLIAAVPLAALVAWRWAGPLAEWGGVTPALAAFGLVPLALLAGLVAMNVANTFDNHDGALVGVACVGLLPAAPVAAAAVAGFLPWNVDAEGWSLRRRVAPGATPTAYLGDAGSHLLGFVALANPWAWPLFVLPAMDLVRLARLRWRAGSAPWVGDRRHLAHGLAARGWSRTGVWAALALATAPAALVVRLARVRGPTDAAGIASALLLAAASTAVVFLVLLRVGQRE